MNFVYASLTVVEHSTAFFASVARFAHSRSVRLDFFCENRGLMEWAAKVDFRQQGVVVPICGPVGLNFGDRYLALTGIPYRFGKARAGEVTALTADTLKRLDPPAIREILSGAVIADGSAALWLAQNGFADDTGVKAKVWNRKTIQIHEFEDGFHQLGMRTGGLMDLSEFAAGAKVLTKLLNRPRMGEKPVYEAPGSVLYENPRGGKVLTFAQSLPSQTPAYYEATLFSECYKAEIVRWLTRLGGGLPGGVYYLGPGPVTCEAGAAATDVSSSAGSSSAGSSSTTVSSTVSTTVSAAGSSAGTLSRILGTLRSEPCRDTCGLGLCGQTSYQSSETRSTAV